MAALVHAFWATQSGQLVTNCHQTWACKLKRHVARPRLMAVKFLLSSRAAGLIENLTVDVYGDKVPLRSLGAISVRDAQTLLVSPWDKGVRCDLTCFAAQLQNQAGRQPQLAMFSSRYEPALR